MARCWKGLFLRAVTGTLCLAAAYISYNLLLKHVTGTSSQSWFEAGCAEDTVLSRANCDAVLATPYSYFPPIRESERASRWHIPAALLGLLYYSSLCIWSAGIGIPSYERRWIHAVPLMLVDLGLLASFYYTIVMFRVLNEWCPWCLVTHILNLLIAICLFCMWAQSNQAAYDKLGHRTAKDVPGRLVRPSWSAVAWTVTMTVAVGYGHVNLYAELKWKQDATASGEQLRSCRRSVERIGANHDLLVKLWETRDRCEVTIRADDPIRQGASNEDHRFFDVVVFSDFTCPACARFTRMLEDRIVPLFGGHLKIVYKHYPLDRDCNSRIARTSHAGACEAARMAEAARSLGGNDAFWQAHDLLYAQLNEPIANRLTAARLAAELKLDPVAFQEMMQSEEITSRLAEDVEQAKVCGAHATPTVVAAGSLIASMVLMNVEFWDRLADLYWKQIGRPRPEASGRPKTVQRAPG